MISTSRFNNLVNVDFVARKRFSFIGCGSVGSNLVNTACAFGIRHIYLFDDDVVAPENINVSWLDRRNIGMAKSDSILIQCNDLYRIDPISFTEKYRNQSLSVHVRSEEHTSELQSH